MKKNFALSAVVALVLTACASQPVATAPVVYQVANLNSQAQFPPPQAQPQPAPELYNYEQRSWPQSASTQEWKGFVPTGYQPPPNNAFDATPAYGGGYTRTCWVGDCPPGAGLSVGFGIGGASVGIGPCGISAGVGLGCSPIGVWCGPGYY
jgi:hypothetical protein